MMENARKILERFLSMPLSNSDGIFELFSALPGAVTGCGEKPLQRYVFVPGSRKDAVVLVAHGDTIWDAHYGDPKETKLCFHDGVFTGENPHCGIGADDRGGCAMLWALRESGHSLLLTDGEEYGKLGMKYLKKSNRRLFRKLNRHRFAICLDWQGTNGCLYNQVDNTRRFQDYITRQLGFQDSHAEGGSDLQILCKRICGVNVGVGYHRFHRPGESLDVTQWENTRACLEAFLRNPQPRFPVSGKKRILGCLRKGKRLAGKLLKKMIGLWKGKGKDA